APRVERARPRQPLADMQRSAGLEWRFVDVSASPLAAVEQLAMVWVGNRADMRLAVNQQANGNAPVVQAINKAGRAVDRIDHPDATGLEISRPTLLAEKTVLWKLLGKASTNEILDARVGDADHFLPVVTLVLHIQRLALPVEIHAQLGSFQGEAFGTRVAGVEIEGGRLTHGGS